MSGPNSDREPLVNTDGKGPEAAEKQNQCGKICGGVCCAFVVLLLWVALRIWTANCAIEPFDFELILPKNAKNAGVPEPFERGTKKNMHLPSSLNIDLAGTWWMDGNPLTFEQLVSYAGATADSDKYPAWMRAPSNLQRHWTWSDDFVGRAIVAYYMWTTTPDSGHQYNFTNSSYADIVPVAGVFGDAIFGFKNINDNEWDRVGTYVLRRIVSADGEATRFWPKFEKWYKETFPHGKMIVLSSNNNCLRKCQYLLPCFMCDLFC
jgi:hypothetical protein